MKQGLSYQKRKWSGRCTCDVITHHTTVYYVKHPPPIAVYMYLQLYPLSSLSSTLFVLYSLLVVYYLFNHALGTLGIIIQQLFNQIYMS